MRQRPTLLSITIAIAGCMWVSALGALAQDNPMLLPEWMLAPRVVTGQVSVTRFRCVTAPCPPPVVLVDDQVISGPIAADVMAFDGEYVSVRGVDSTESQLPNISVFKAESFTPDPDTKWDFITGTIEVQGGVVSIHTATGKVYKIVGAASSQALLRANSAQVTLYGTISKIGARARVQDFEIHSPTFMARGDLHSLMHIMGGDDAGAIAIPPARAGTQWPDYVLRIPSGRSFPIYGEIVDFGALGAGQGETRWLTIDARNMNDLRAIGVSKPYHPIGIDPVWPLTTPIVPAPQALGVNTHRNADTTGRTASNPTFVQQSGMERE